MFGIGAIAMLVLLIAITKVRVAVTYVRLGANDHLVLDVSVWFGLIRRKYDIPVMKWMTTDSGPTFAMNVRKSGEPEHNGHVFIDEKAIRRWMRVAKEWRKKVHDLYPILRWILRRFRLERVEWHTALGIGDAAATGTLTGLVWGVKSVILSTVSHYVTLRAIPRMSVQPVWNGNIVRTRFRCILTFRIGYAIVAGVRILLKLRKGRERKWETTPSRA